MLRKLKENKRGFTLVELIVVLIILGILAAMLLPTLTGYIDKAREKRAMVEAREVLLAGRTCYAEYYAHREATPPGGTQLTKAYIATYFTDWMKAEFGMQYPNKQTLRTSLKNGNAYAIETGLMKKQEGATKLIDNVKGNVLGGNCVEYYVKNVKNVKNKSFESLVGLNYISKDKKYLVTIVLEPENTQDYKDVAPGTFIIQKIE